MLSVRACGSTRPEDCNDAGGTAPRTHVVLFHVLFVGAVVRRAPVFVKTGGGRAEQRGVRRVQPHNGTVAHPLLTNLSEVLLSMHAEAELAALYVDGHVPSDDDGEAKRFGHTAVFAAAARVGACEHHRRGSNTPPERLKLRSRERRGGRGRSLDNGGDCRRCVRR